MVNASGSIEQSGRSLPRWLRLITRIFILVLAFLIVLTVITLLLGAKAKADLKAKYPPPGQLVDIGGYRLHIDCQGTGNPTVILEAGLGEPSLTWAMVQPQLVSGSRVCVYDRAGLGWSDASPKPRTAELMVAELHTLLNNAKIPGPYVLVGHSVGGMLVRMYAHSYPVDIVGMVLVDATHEEQFSRLPAAVQQNVRQNFAQASQGLPLYRVVTITGIGALVPAIGALADNPQLPSPARETYSALLLSDPKFSEAKVAEGEATLDMTAELRAAHITTLGNIPLMVLYNGLAGANMPGMTAAENIEYWVKLQTELAALSPQGKLQAAAQSGHFIQLDQPKLVIDAIQQVVTTARK